MAIHDRRFLISVDRLFGVHAWRAEAAFEGGQASTESDLGGTMVNLLVANTSTNSPDGVLNPFAAPRLAGDAILPLCFTVGTALGYLSVSGEREDRVPGSAPTITPFPQGHAWLIAPRVGWLQALTEWVAIWPRTGVTFVSVGDTNGGHRSKFDFFTLSIDPAVVFTPADHVAVLVGPALDFALGGSGETVEQGATQSLKISFSNFGAAIGAAFDI